MQACMYIHDYKNYYNHLHLHMHTCAIWHTSQKRDMHVIRVKLCKHSGCTCTRDLLQYVQRGTANQRRLQLCDVARILTGMC